MTKKGNTVSNLVRESELKEEVIIVKAIAVKVSTIKPGFLCK